MSAAATDERLGGFAPQVFAVDLVDQRVDVGRGLELAPADVLGDEPGVMALERVGRVVLPELHELLGALLDAAVAVIDVALGAADDVGDRHVEPLPLADDLRHFLPVLRLVAPLLGFHHRHQQRLGGVRILVDPGGAHAERLLRMLGPDFAGRAGGEADALVDELLVPRLADAEGVHVADLHVRHHLRRRHDDGRDVLVGIDAAGGEPVANPQIVRAAGEGHRDLHFLAGGLLLLEGGLQRRGVGGDLQVLVFVGDRDRLRIEIEPRQDVHRRRHVVLRHLAGRDQVRHRRQDMRAVDAVRFADRARCCRASRPRKPAWRLRRRACRTWRRCLSPWRSPAERHPSARYSRGSPW